MSRSRRRRSPLRPVPLLAAAVAVAAAVGTAAVLSSPNDSQVTLHNAANSGIPLQAAYQAVNSWGTGYTGQYTITNTGTAPVTGWTLGFSLPNGTTLTSLWDGTYTDSGGQVTVTNAGWDATVQPGKAVTVGFVTASSGSAGQPANCTINGAACQAGGAGPAGTPTASPSPVPSSATAPAPSPTPSRSIPRSPGGSATPSQTSSAGPAPSGPASSAPAASNGAPSAGTAGFAPYVDTSLFPPFNLVSTAQATGVKQFNLAFVVSGGGGGCTPEWGGVTAIGTDPVASQIGALRAQDPGLQVSLTLPVLPSGLTPDGDAVLTGAVHAGVKISAVNVMAMDYGDGAAPNPNGQMGTFAIDAATATDAQVAAALGISDAAAWSKIAVTPMIGVNDTSDEIFTIANAQQLAAFAASKHLAWLSMWSAARDTQCPGGVQGFAQPTCSSIASTPGQFMNTLGAY